MDKKEIQAFELPSGAVVEFETIPEQRGGPGEVSPKKKSMISIPFEQVIEPLGEVSSLIFEKLRSSVKAPETVEIEMGAAIKGNTRLLIVSGEARASIKVTLSWTNKDR